MRSHKPRLYSTAMITADIVGLMHFFVANIIFLLGEVTPLFAKFGGEHPGLTFVCTFFDQPLASMFANLISGKGDLLTVVLGAQVVIIGSSLLYGLVVFFALKVLTLFISVATGRNL